MKYKCCTGKNNSFYGKHHSAETRYILSIKQKQNAAVNPNSGMKGKHHSTETKKRISEHHLQIRDFFKEINRKYSVEFIEQLKLDYLKLGSYRKVAEKYEMDATRVYNLIKYGSTSGRRVQRLSERSTN